MNRVYKHLDLIETFLRIGESHSLSQATRALGITQPTASRRLAELERMLGCKLASRTTTAFTLTDEGRMLLEEARELTGRCSGLAERLRERGGNPEGTLHVICPSGYAGSFVTDAATDLIAAHPGLRVALSLTDRGIDLTASGAECCVFVGPVPNLDIICKTLGTMQRILVAAPPLLKRIGTITVARLPQLPFVSFKPHVHREIRLLSAGGHTHTVALKHTTLETTSLTASYRAILNGAGIGSLAHWMCSPDIEAGRLTRVLPRWSLEPIGVHVALPPGHYRPARVTAFIDALRSRLQKQPGFTAANRV